MESSFNGFKKGKAYTRKFISDELGGGIQDYLPHKNGIVVCGCFKRDFNPRAPDEILVGEGRDIEKWAKVFCEQKNNIPVFIKYRSNEWIYVGDYHVSRWTDDRRDLEEHRIRAGWEKDHPVKRVLFLEKRQ